MCFESLLTVCMSQGYKIQAWRWDGTTDVNTEQKIVSVPPNLLDPLTEQSAAICGLEKFTEYNITVLCFTEPGDGPRSDYILVRTKEDSKYKVKLLLIHEMLQSYRNNEIGFNKFIGMKLPQNVPTNLMLNYRST